MIWICNSLANVYNYFIILYKISILFHYDYADFTGVNLLWTIWELEHITYKLNKQ